MASQFPHANGDTMFLIKAVFWFTVVAVAIPRDPGDGFARGSNDHTLVWLDHLHENALARLALVKAQIETQDTAHGPRGVS
jgi:hypothetical protein